MRGALSVGVLACGLGLGACAQGPGSASEGLRIERVLLTSEAGHKVASVRPSRILASGSGGPVIEVFPDERKQELYGIGSSFTESSAFVLAHLEPAARREVMRRAFGESGANFSLTRTHIASCDFTVEGRYSYAPQEGDTDLSSFSIAPDLEGFDKGRYPGVVDPTYDLLPMIREAQAIKAAQGDGGPRIIASAWTAPPWMKDTGEWYIRGSEENDWQGTGGSLKPEYFTTYADYLIRYLDAYERMGVDVWAITPVNEPHGNNGQWESMHFSPASQGEFIEHALGPRLRDSDHADTRVLIYDQNRAGLEEWTDTILGDPGAAAYCWGVAVHWYSSTYKVYEETFERVHEKFPGFPIIQTEGCIDDLGKPAPAGIADPDRFQESGWFMNDSFWWNANATDWAYTASWASPSVEDHPIYTPVHRYARDIIVGIDHWLAGWVDWNLVLDARGGPNHVGNFCGAPIMIDTEGGEIYYTPLFHVMDQLSRTIRPGDHALRTEQSLGSMDEDALRACATVNGEGLISVQMLNTTKRPIDCTLRVAGRESRITVPANSVQTVRLRR